MNYLMPGGTWYDGVEHGMQVNKFRIEVEG